MSTAEALQVMLEFGGFTINLLTLVIALNLLTDKKK
ncbi:TPA: putative holin-like toxin [Streptococcus suis]|nr:putative holin-like toxin [Streptococcus suis]UUM58338.1 putative holin-like toxin [Streptococcus suis]